MSLSSSKKRFREIDGILLLDKPKGLSSNQALQRVRHLYKAAKAGHTGSLDPLATGVLPICLGEATKFSQFLLDADKTYFTRATLGARTDSGDAEGNVIEERPVPALSQELLQQVVARFRGEIEQVPPMYSALKHQGQPLYKLARQGIEIERPARRVTIHSLTLLAWGEDYLELEVHCSKGTYIRTLVEDIGEALGCGAHVSVLRRDQSAGFTLAQCHGLEQLRAVAEAEGVAEGVAEDEALAALDQLLLPIDAGLEHIPDILLNSRQTGSILQGQMVRITPGLLSGMVRIRDADQRFIGLGEISGDQLKPRRLLRFG